jgi:hypothetical protein
MMLEINIVLDYTTVTVRANTLGVYKYFKIDFVPHRKQRIYMIKINLSVLLKDIITVCSEKYETYKCVNYQHGSRAESLFNFLFNGGNK